MSKKMDYTRYSKESVVSKKPVETVETVVEEVKVIEPVESIETVVEDTHTVATVAEIENEEPVVEEAKIEEPEAIIGVVTNCLKLNVREQPDKNADILGVIDAATELAIFEDESTEDFYKICTSAGVEGYCMKKFVTIIP